MMFLKSRKVLIIITLAVLAICACLYPALFVEDRLSKEEVQALRNEYPFYDDVQDDSPFMNISPAAKTRTIRDYIKKMILSYIVRLWGNL